MRGTTARTRGSAQTDDYDSGDDSEEDENEVLDRTKKPPVPQGFHVVAAQDAKSMVEEDDWADELEGGATHMVTRFDVEAEEAMLTATAEEQAHRSSFGTQGQICVPE